MFSCGQDILNHGLFSMSYFSYPLQAVNFQVSLFLLILVIILF